MASDPLGAASLPYRFGRYQLLDVLGEGGFAKVYRADLEGPAGFRKRVALKLIKGRTQDQERELNHEGRLGGLLKHRNVVDTYELGLVDDTVYLAMELIDGLSLRQLMEQGSLPQAVVLEVLHGVVRGLAYAHTLRSEAGIVHLDLKPENVLIGWDGSVKVTDFGIARLFGAGAQGERNISGTPRYMSPEQWTEQTLTSSSDVFSFGLMAAEMVLEHPLIHVGTVHHGEVFNAKFDADVAESIVQLDGMISGFGACIGRCLRRAPEERYASAQELLQPIRALWRQVGNEPLLEDWLSEVLEPAADEALLLSPGSPSVYVAGVSDTITLEPEPDQLGTLELALRTSENQDSALAALAKLEGAISSLTVERRGQWLSSGVAVLGAAGFEVMRDGGLPFLVVDSEKKQFWLAGQSAAKFRGKALGGRLLYAIATHGDTWDRERLWVEVWQQPYRPPSSDTALRVQVHRLRDKIKEAGLVIEGQSDGRYVLQGRPAVLCWRGEKLEFSHSQPPQETPEAAVPTTNLAPEVNGFWGRGEEQDRLLKKWQEGCRLVSLHGPPGVGKSRFAKHVARKGLESGLFERVWACNFARVKDEEGLLTTFSETLGLDAVDGGGQEQTLRRLNDVFLEHGKTLWVLEHPESVNAVLGPMLQSWWQEHPQVSVVVVGQRPLDLEQSVRFRLDPMPLPPQTTSLEQVSEWPVLALFEERARMVKPGFALSEENLAAVCGIVSAVDGLALGIELAASRVGMMSPRQILQRLDARLQLLSGRQGGLRGSLEWAWGLLSEGEQRVLAQFSVFQGGCSWAAAESILSSQEWVIDVLGCLVDHSLISVSEQGDVTRLNMLSVVREFASEKLKEMDGLREAVELRHLHWYAAHGGEAETRARRIIGEDGSPLYAERKNLAAAVERALALGLAHEAQSACLAAMDVLRQVGPLNGGIRLAKRVLARCGESSETRVRLVLALAELQLRVGRREEAEAHFNQLISDASAPAVMALCQLSRKRMEEGQAEPARALLDTAVEYAQVLGLSHLSSLVNMRLGDWCLKQGQIEEALSLLNQAAVLAEAIGDRELLIDAHRYLGVAHWTLGDLEQAAERYGIALEWSRSLGRRKSEASLCVGLAIVEDNRGHSEQACHEFEQALRLYESLGDRLEIQFVLVNWGVALERLGRLAEARALYERALGLARGTQNARVHGVLLGNLAVLHARSQEFDRAEQLFTEALELHRTVGNQREECIALTNLGHVNRDLKREDQSQRLFEQALVLAEALKDAKQQAVLRGLLKS